jgi:hypothetical protein
VKRDVSIQGDKVVVRPKPDDAIARLRQMNIRAKVVTGRLTDEERDVALLALRQDRGLLDLASASASKLL